VKKALLLTPTSNEKRLREEKNELIEIDSKYYETEKKSDEDLAKAVEKLNEEQKSVEKIINIFGGENFEKNISKLNEIKSQLNYAKNYLKEQKLDDVANILETSNANLDDIINSFENSENKNKIKEIISKNENIKKFQEDYANSFSKNQSIKNESIKRNERIKTIETEIESWINLLTNSEKMVTELNARKNKLSENSTNLKLNLKHKQKKKVKFQKV